MILYCCNLPLQIDCTNEGTCNYTCYECGKTKYIEDDSLDTMVRDFTSVYPRSKSGVRKRLLAYREKILIEVLAKLEGAEDVKTARHFLKNMIGNAKNEHKGETLVDR